MIAAVKAATLLATVTAVVVWVAVRHTTGRAAEARDQARARVAARRRADAGMPSGHPEIPGPPMDIDAAELNGFYAHVADELSDIEIGGQP